MSWLHPLNPTKFTALAKPVKVGRPRVRVKYKGKRYADVRECAEAHGFSVGHMKKLLARSKKRRHF